MSVRLNKHQAVYFVTIVASFFLTFINIHNYPVFNPDAVEYVRVAQLYLNHGFHAAIMAYDWPFYSILLALIHKLTGLSFINVGYLFNYLFSALLAMAFIRFLEECGASFRQLCFAAVTILVWHMFVKYQSDIIRGHIYWFFVMLSILLANRFAKRISWMNGLAWSVSVFLGTLMRSEFLFFLIFYPFSVFLFPALSFREKVHAFLKQNILLVIFSVLFFVIFFIFGVHKFLTFTHIPGLFKVGLDFYPYVKSAIHAQLHLISSHAAHHPSGLLMFYGLLLLLLKFIFAAVGYFSVVYSVLFLYSLYARTFIFDSRQIIVLSAYAMFAFLIALVFYCQSLEINGRYLFAGLLPLLCFVPFGLESVWLLWRHRSKQNHYISLFAGIVCLLMFAMLLSNLFPFGSRHKALYDASQWLKYNTLSRATVYTNSGQLALLSERNGDGWVPFSNGAQFDWSNFSNHPWKGYNYLVLDVDSHHLAYKKSLVKLLGAPTVIFKEKHSAAVMIFRLK